VSTGGLAGRERELHLGRDASVGGDFEKAPRGAFADKRVAVGQALAGEDLRVRWRVVIKNDAVSLAGLGGAGDLLDAGAGGEEQIAVGEYPEVVAVGRRIFPFDFSNDGNDENFAASIIGADKGML